MEDKFTQEKLLHVVKASDYPEPINVTKLEKRVETLETTVKLQDDTIRNILDSLVALRDLLRKLNERG